MNSLPNNLCYHIFFHIMSENILYQWYADPFRLHSMSMVFYSQKAIKFHYSMFSLRSWHKHSKWLWLLQLDNIIGYQKCDFCESENTGRVPDVPMCVMCSSTIYVESKWFGINTLYGLSLSLCLLSPIISRQ